MDDLLAPLQNALEGQIDFHGQRLADILSTVLLVAAGAAAFIVGYLAQDIYLTFWVMLMGTVLTAFVIIPPWPPYNRHPEKWLSSFGGLAGTEGIIVEGVKGG